MRIIFSFISQHFQSAVKRSARTPNRCITGVWLTLNYTFYRLPGFADTAFLPPVHFCGHHAFTACPLLWTPRFYRLSTFVDTALLPSVHFCGHPAFYCLSTFVDTLLFTACPLLWTPRFLLPVHFCGHRAFTVCPLLWTPRLYCLSGSADTSHTG